MGGHPWPLIILFYVLENCTGTFGETLLEIWYVLCFRTVPVLLSLQYKNPHVFPCSPVWILLSLVPKHFWAFILIILNVPNINSNRLQTSGSNFWPLALGIVYLVNRDAYIHGGTTHMLRPQSHLVPLTTVATQLFCLWTLTRLHSISLFLFTCCTNLTGLWQQWW